MKVLNLDKLDTKPQRKLVLGGKSYPVEQMTVENFISTTHDAEKINEETTLADQIQFTVDMICRRVPSIDRDVLCAVPLENLQTIVAFVRGEDLDEVGEAEEKGADEGK